MKAPTRTTTASAPQAMRIFTISLVGPIGDDSDSLSQTQAVFTVFILNRNKKNTPTHHPVTSSGRQREVCGDIDDIDPVLEKTMVHLPIDFDINNNTYERESLKEIIYFAKYFPHIPPSLNQNKIIKIKIVNDNRLGRGGSGVILVPAHLGLFSLTSLDPIVVTLTNDLSKNIYTILIIHFFIGNKSQLLIKKKHIVVRYLHGIFFKTLFDMYVCLCWCIFWGSGKLLFLFKKNIFFFFVRFLLRLL